MTDIPDWNEITGPEKDAIIRPLWDDGVSASLIAIHHFRNATRNMVIGRVTRGKMQARKPAQVLRDTRMKPLPKPPKPPKQAKAPKARKPIPAQPGTPPIMSTIPDPDMPSASVMHMIENNRPPLPGMIPVDILHLPQRPGVRCRFPVVGGYCGAPSGDKTHCPTHHEIMYRPTEKIRMPKEARR